MTEMIMRAQAVNQVTAYIQTTTKNLEEEIKKNEELKVELVQKQEELEAQIESYQAVIAEQYGNKNSNYGLLSRTKERRDKS